MPGEERRERAWDLGFKLHGLVGHGMVEAETESMETETADGIVAIAILDIATHRMA